MGIVTITLPDIGEGIAEAELTEWNVAIGDVIQDEDVLGVVMTDKAAVEVPTSVAGRVVWLAGDPGDAIAIGADFVRIEVDGIDTPEAPAEQAQTPTQDIAPTPAPPPAPKPATPSERPAGLRPLAAPTVRQYARDKGVDLTKVTGSGPGGRILRGDIDAPQSNGPAKRAKATGGRDVKVIGMRRKIAEKMALSKARIPHITIVEEVDVTDLEDLRAKLNTKHGATRGKLTILPFVARAIVEAVREQPQMNATFDDEAGVIHEYNAVNIGIAAQTPAGLTVPVVKNAEAMTPWHMAGEVKRLSDAAKSGKSDLADLTGATITISSLGPLGAIATTPIINHPEVAIVGVNKIAVRPVWDGHDFVPRKMMNLSSSFDHRVIDGWDAAVFVQKLKELLETPALLFVES